MNREELPQTNTEKESNQTIYSTSTADIIALSQNGDSLSYAGRYSQSFEAYNKALETTLASGKSTPNEQSSLYQKLGMASLKKAGYTEALQFLTKALEIRKESDDENSLEMIRLKIDLGQVYHAQSKFLEAHDIFENCRQNLMLYYRDQVSDIIRCYQSISEAYSSKGKYTEALESAQESININTDSNEVELAKSYYLIGYVHKKLANYPEAIKYSEIALQIQEKLHGKNNHPDIASIYNAIGHVYFDLSKYEQAWKYYEMSLNIRRDFLGDLHPSVAASYNNIAMVQKETEKYEAALENYQKCLKIEVSCLGEKHTELASTYNNIGLIYFLQDKFSLARQEHQKALDIQLAGYREFHPAMVSTYNLLGNACRGMNDLENAEVYLAKSLQIGLDCFGSSHPQLAYNYDNLGLLCLEKKDYASSLTNLYRSLRIRQLYYENNHDYVARSHNNLLSVFRNVGDMQSAKACTRKVAQISTQFFGREHHYTRNIKVDAKFLEKKISRFECNADLRW